MRYAALFNSKWWLAGVLLPCAAVSLGCQGTVQDTHRNGAGGSGQGPGAGGASATGTAGTGVSNAPCTGATDPRMVVAPQRIINLTNAEVLNTVRYLTDATEATMLQSSGNLGSLDEKDRRFPPLSGPSENTTISDSGTWQSLDNAAQHVMAYVGTNFARLTGCTTATDACATTYLSSFATKAYRRKLTAAEQSRVTALYNKLKSQTVNGYTVTATVQEATQYAVYAILSSPQMLWRWELGDPNLAAASGSPPGIPLTDSELATHLAFFLTDQPPDDTLLNLADGGQLRANLTAQVDRLMATQAARDWLRTIMSTWFLLNQLHAVDTVVDTAKFPIFSVGLLNDMATEANKFLDNVLWNGNLTDILLSRTTYLNTGLAASIYNVPAPAGATSTNFAQVTLPSDQRAGILTNAAFITRAARSDEGSVVARGKAIAGAIFCTPPPPPPPEVSAPGGPLDQAKAMFSTQTVQQQVAYRKAIPLCGGCHASFDPYGLVLDYYDNIGRYRTIDDRGGPVDGHTNLPQSLGGALVNNAIDVANIIGNSPAFTNCMATTVLQYAMVDYSAPVQLPLPPGQPGCAAADVVAKYNAGGAKTFAALVRAAAGSPAFVLRARTN
ncbi:MAG TPA: DUF1592 domain-containing protein [Polyangia bacterium]|nr:DUF1592 domain-containing protein [Polyangia bacterium]